MKSKYLAVCFTAANLHCFLQPEIMRLYLPSARALGYVVWPVAVIACSQGIPPDFYLPHVNLPLLPLCATLRLCTSLPISETLPLLLIWMNAVS